MDENEVKNVAEDKKEEVKEEVNEEVSVADNVKANVSSFLSRASAFCSKVADVAAEKTKEVREEAKVYFDKGADFIEEKRRERDAEEVYEKLGKKVYRLVSRGELTLPECCDKYIQSLNEILEDADAGKDDDDCVKKEEVAEAADVEDKVVDAEVKD